MNEPLSKKPRTSSPIEIDFETINKSINFKFKFKKK